MLLRSSHPRASRNLQRAYDDHQREHGCAPLPPETAIEQGWIIGLARFRDTLSREFRYLEAALRLAKASEATRTDRP